MPDGGEIRFESHNTFDNLRIKLIKYELVPLIPNAPTASDDNFHNKLMRVSAFGINDHIM
jgi:hypothetical protein